MNGTGSRAATSSRHRARTGGANACRPARPPQAGTPIRPYRLLCLTCALGEGRAPARGPLKQLLRRIRQEPDLPLTLVCNAGDVYAYQDPGTADDSPEGRDFNRKRDLDILQRMDWPPGITLPARTVLKSLHKHIPTVAGLCAYASVTGPAWRGCPKAGRGCYEKGHSKGLATLLRPRSRAEMLREKRESIGALRRAGVVSVRPHILLCAVCQYGQGLRPPYAEDNLPELMDLILHGNPDLPIRMAPQADWMMCAPCPSRVPKLNACVHMLGSCGLANEKRDLDMLQILGLEFGSTMKARELFTLIFERFPTPRAVCSRDNRSPSVWWDSCAEFNMRRVPPAYVKGRRQLMNALARPAGPAQGGTGRRTRDAAAHDHRPGGKRRTRHGTR